MRNNLIKSVVTAICFTMLLVPAPVTAQSSGLGLSVKVSPTAVSPGSTVGVIAVVANNSSSKIRTTVTFTSVSPCGEVTSIGYHRVSLDPGAGMIVTTTYPIPPDACLGMYEISVDAKTG